MKFKALVLSMMLCVQYGMGNVYAELFSDYVFYEGYPAGIYPDKDGNPRNVYDQLHGLIRNESGSGSQAVVYEGNYINGQKEGVFQLKSTVYEGVILEEETYKNGVQDGEEKTWVFLPKQSKANPSDKEYHILMRKTLYQAQGNGGISDEVGGRKTHQEPKEMQKIQLSIGSSGSSEFSDIRAGAMIVNSSINCDYIVLSKNDSTQGNEHHYWIQIPNYKMTWRDFYSDSDFKKRDKKYCHSQYGFFETLLERFEKGEFDPFSNDSDYQMTKPSLNKYDGSIEFSPRSVGVGLGGVVLQSMRGYISEKITETINGATYKLNLTSVSGGSSIYLFFTKNGVKIDPRVYNQEEFNTLLNKFYDKEMVRFISENIKDISIN